MVVAAIMVNRAVWTAGQPFGDHVPMWAPTLFAVGAAALISVAAWPTPWGPRLATTAALGVATPYVFYILWILQTIPLARVRGTIGELALVPWLVVTAWPKIPGGDR